MWNTGILGDLKKVDKYMENALKSSQRILSEAIDDLLKGGGKRLRPALLLLSGKLGEYDSERLVPLAAAVEILHMATLVHDDIIDESKLRRGKPTVQNRWGKDIAVFTGDFLFSKSFLIISQKTNIEDMERIARAIQAICQGEIDQYETRYSFNVSINRYLKRIARKTALLFALSCRIGAEESKCSKKIIHHAVSFGKAFGMAFQITDDLLDFQGNQAEVGKTLLNDFVQGVYTLPVIYAMQNDVYSTNITELVEKDNINREDVEKLLVWVKKSGGLEYSRKLASRYIQRARHHLAGMPDSEAKRAFGELLNELLERRY